MNRVFDASLFSYMRGGIIVPILIAGIVTSGSGLVAAQAINTSSVNAQSVLSAQDTSSQKIRVVTSTTAFDNIFLDQYLNEQDKLKYVSAFQELINRELAIYPAGYLYNTIGLTKVVASAQVRMYDTPVSGTADPFQTNTLYFTVNAQSLAAEDGQYLPEIIHHELAHFLYGKREGRWSSDDKLWKACNTATDVYQSGGYAMQSDPGYSRSIHPQEGFITGYASASIDEDKAEMFSNLVKYRGRLNKVASDDSHVLCKVRLTIQLVPGMKF
jgi:Putative zinc-binding metallo-peptidase